MSNERETEASSERDESSTEGGEDEDEEPVESLVQGRVKRTTAGSRMSTLVDREGDEDLDLLFAEDEEDEDMEFEEDDDAASDAEMDSSTDEEDQGPTKGEEDMTGEKELQKQERAERKKRKAHDVFKKPSVLRKRVKIDESATATSASPSEPATRPKKKSERVSWVHSAADAPTRTSSRKQTVKNREIVHKRLLDSERQRAKVMRQMEEAQKRKEARKVKPMTQAEHLEEAAKVERKNAKSLNRWEEAEKKRAQEQKAKLEALHNRQLSGPVISWWSGITRWLHGKITETGVREIRGAGHHEEQINVSHTENQMDQSKSETEKRDTQMDEPSKEDLSQPREKPQPPQPSGPPSSIVQEPMTSSISFGFLDGIHAYAALPVPQPQPEFTGTAHDDQAPAYSAAPMPLRIVEVPSEPAAPVVLPPPPPPPPPEPPAPKPEYFSRNLIALKNIDANAAKLPELQDGILLVKKKAGKLHKTPTETCAITSQPAKFRDPKTGLAYANSYAYSQIQALQKGGSRWSDLLECYVGSSTVVARGVPERFWKRA